MVLETCPYHAGLGGGMMGFGYGFWIQILILIAFFAVIWWVMKGQQLIQTPTQILENRLARGEITKKEFDDLKKSLSK